MDRLPACKCTCRGRETGNLFGVAKGSTTRKNPVRDFKSLAFYARFQDSWEYFKISRVFVNTLEIF